MKSQDILLLFKMTSLHIQEEIWMKEGQVSMPAMEDYLFAKEGENLYYANKHLGHPSDSIQAEHYQDWGLFGSGTSKRVEGSLGGWEGWDDVVPAPPVIRWDELYSLRALSSSLGLSKSEVSNSIARCRESGLLTNDYETSLPKVNRRALLGIAEHALKYFFPVKLGAIVRGIPTGFAAPALSKHLKSAGELIPVWPDPLGKERGQAIEPLYKSVPDSVKKDRTLYHYLALADAIRVGGPRESKVAVNLLKTGMGL
jgi:hypothetical protein